jgi:hypothetical protein
VPSSDWPTGLETSRCLFLFGRSEVQARRQAIMNKVCRSRPVSPQTNAGVVPGMKPIPRAAVSFPIHYLLLILPFGGI